MDLFIPDAVSSIERLDLRCAPIEHGLHELEKRLDNGELQKWAYFIREVEGPVYMRSQYCMGSLEE